MHIARRLVELGATVSAHDPVVKSLPQVPALKIADDPYAAADRADAVVVVTEWRAYRDLDFPALAAAMTGRLLIDGRNCIEPGAAAAAGLAYEGIGRSAEPSGA